jgi:hypothetical protein
MTTQTTIDPSIPCRTACCVLPRNHSGDHCTQAEANEIANELMARKPSTKGLAREDRRALIASGRGVVKL